MSSLSLARRERHALCDLALELGPAAPTLCDGWDALDLVAHCFVREHRPLAAVGSVIGPLSALSDHAMARARRRGLPALVDKVRDPGWTPFALPPVEVLANTLEYVVHHEDLRRAQPGWEPRPLDRSDQDTIWGSLRLAGRMLVRPAGVPVLIRRSDDPTQIATLRQGEDPATVTGLPSELTMFLFGRDQHRGLEYDGPPAAVAALRAAGLGF